MSGLVRPANDIKFSPDGMTLAAAADDGRVYFYDVQGNFTFSRAADAAAAPGYAAVHLDFTADGRWVRVCSSGEDGACGAVFVPVPAAGSNGSSGGGNRGGNTVAAAADAPHVASLPLASFTGVTGADS
ncbi:unnamed protein product, partial [Phaeothamnion confervicola]